MSTSDLPTNDEIMLITCPISSQIMLDPILAEDGNSYEKQVFEMYIDSKINNNLPIISPMTREEISSEYFKNRALKDYIEHLISKYPLLKNDQYVLDKNYEEEKIKRQNETEIRIQIEKESRKKKEEEYRKQRREEDIIRRQEQENAIYFSYSNIFNNFKY